MCAHMRNALALLASDDTIAPNHAVPVDANGSSRPDACSAGHASSSAQRSSLGCCASVHNAAIIVDPETGRIIAQGMDATRAPARHPLRHAVMVAIEAAAARDRALWPEHSGAQAAAQHAALAAGAWAPGSAAAAASSEACGGCSQPPDAKRQRLELQAGACAASGQDAGGWQPAQKSYLCTGFDCYVVREPCVMCAMALVHSRLRRVIYALPDARGGALGGALRLHSQRSLNHHYHVYHCALKDCS